jgi:1,4-alpha-glucan branching enzyme
MNYTLPVGCARSHDEESYNTYEQITERLVPYVKEMALLMWNLCRDGSIPSMELGFINARASLQLHQVWRTEGLMHLIDSLHGQALALSSIGCHRIPYDAHGLHFLMHTYLRIWRYAQRLSS